MEAETKQEALSELTETLREMLSHCEDYDTLSVNVRLQRDDIKDYITALQDEGY